MKFLSIINHHGPKPHVVGYLIFIWTTSILLIQRHQF